MSVRSVAALATAVLVASAGLVAPALARPAQRHAVTAAPCGVDPLGVLAGRTARGFSDRTAGMVAIVGAGTGVAPMRIPLRPVHPAGMRREADAAANLR